MELRAALMEYDLPWTREVLVYKYCSQNIKFLDDAIQRLLEQLWIHGAAQGCFHLCKISAGAAVHNGVEQHPLLHGSERIQLLNCICFIHLSPLVEWGYKQLS
ncbi:hypothetical protein D3C78_773730 [compost metagenome]